MLPGLMEIIRLTRGLYLSCIIERKVFVWLTEIINQLFVWMPRIWAVNPDESGVRITLGKWFCPAPSGWYIRWPIIHAVEKITTTPQAIDVRGQSLLTADLKNITVGLVIRYHITDAEKAILKVQNFDESLRAIALGISAEYCLSHRLDELIDTKPLLEQVRDGIAKEASGWGIKVAKVLLSDLGLTQNIRVITDNQPMTIMPVVEDARVE